MTGDSQRRILVVDDDDDIRQMVQVALRMRTLDVDEARNGAEALALLRDHRYAVVILDLLMPAMDGFAVLDAIHDPASPPPPVVLVVTAADRRTIERLDPKRIHGIVRKPFDPMELASVVMACADMRGRETAQMLQ
jgi:CheY-like chemotaxis protein